MKKYSIIYYATSTLLLVSCGASDVDSPVTTLEIKQGSSLRQIQALDGNPIEASVSVNSGSPQRFNIASSSTRVNVTGIRVGERNEVNITWTEILNGVAVEISRQSQSFTANGNTDINAAHEHTMFDYDGDGVSNYDERLGGTCVWSTGSVCGSDTPTDNVQTNNPVTGNLLTNGDFSNRSDPWFSSGFDLTYDSGEFCLSTKTESMNPENATLEYGLNVPLQAGARYTVSADIRAQYSATPRVRFETPSPDFDTIHKETINVSTSYNTVSVSFVARTNYDARFSLQFGDGRINRYCVDNVVIVRSN